LREGTTTECRNTPATTNPEDEEIVDAPGKDGNASMPEQVKRPNTWRKTIMKKFKLWSKEGKKCYGIHKTRQKRAKS